MQGISSGGVEGMGGSALTSSLGSGTLAPVPADEKAERARSMFAHSAGPQWEDVVSVAQRSTHSAWAAVIAL